MTKQLKDPAFLQLWCRMQLQCDFSPWFLELAHAESVAQKKRKKKEKNQLILLAGAICILIPDYEQTSECPYDILHKGSVFMALLREPKIAFSKQWHTEGLGTKSTSICNSEQYGTRKLDEKLVRQNQNKLSYCSSCVSHEFRISISTELFELEDTQVRMW